MKIEKPRSITRSDEQTNKEVIQAKSYDDFLNQLKHISRIDNDKDLQHKLNRMPRIVNKKEAERYKKLLSIGPLTLLETKTRKVVEKNPEFISLLESLLNSLINLKRKSLLQSPYEDINNLMEKIQGVLSENYRDIPTMSVLIMIRDAKKVFKYNNKLYRPIEGPPEAQAFCKEKYNIADKAIEGIDKYLEEADIKYEPAEFAVLDDRISKKEETKESEEGEIQIKINYDLLSDAESQNLPKALKELGELNLEKGHMISLIGPNGIGKSTLLAALQIASIYYNQYPNLSHEEIRHELVKQKILMCSESAAKLARCIDLSGLEGQEGLSLINIDFSKGAMTSVLRNRQEGIMSQMIHRGIMAEQNAYSSSTGEVQEKLIAEAQRKYKLAEFSGLLVIDEPEKGLDAWKLKDMKQRVRKLAPNATILVVTHNPIMVFDSTMERIDLRTPKKGVHINEEEALF